MTLFFVVIFQILLILSCVVIVALSYEIPKILSEPVIPDQLPLDNPTEIGDNGTIEKQMEEDYE